jgi:hypothetical protein
VKLPFILFLSIAILVACSSYRTEPDKPTEIAVAELEVGDTVEVVTAEANKLRFKITAIENGMLVGEDVRVPVDEVRIVSVKRIDARKTAAVGGSVALTALVIVIIVGMMSFAVFP